MPGKFVVKKSGQGFHWNLLAGNGRVIATGEHYESRAAALRGIESVRKNAAGATLVDAGVATTARNAATPSPTAATGQRSTVRKTAGGRAAARKS